MSDRILRDHLVNLREAMLVADHNAYRVGQIVSLRQALGAWQPAALP